MRAGVAELTSEGTRFTDGTTGRFDDIILATGFTAALDPLHGLVDLDAKGFLDQPDLFFVGHNYDATGGLHNVNRDSRLVARLLGCEVRRAGPKWDGLARNGAVTLPIPHP